MGHFVLAAPFGLVVQMTAVETAADGAEHRVVMQHVAGDRAADGARNAADRMSGRGGKRAERGDGDESRLDFAWKTPPEDETTRRAGAGSPDGGGAGAGARTRQAGDDAGSAAAGPTSELLLPARAPICRLIPAF